ncbi:Calcium-transporting ATPase 1 [Durusdinium trenchii]|uniref:Endoplasmic reticulum-type n=2 Tax=Durusdinium trenchii TaxID=1381693 RepID=A0ABP0LCU4_9DINO
MANITLPHCKSVEEVLKFYQVKADAGLSTSQVEEHRAKYGPNALEEQEKKSMLELIIEQFEDTLVRILLASAMISFLLAFFDEKSKEEGLKAYVEPFVILTILILNAVIAIWQDSKAEKALDALKKLAPECAMVLRNGNWSSIDAEDVVPGDILEVRVGDKVPADARVMKLKTTTIKIEQSQLTGESQSVSKEIEELPTIEGKEWVIQEKQNVLFSSTTVSNGACLAVVVATGMSTEIGKIQAAVTKAGEDEEQTPLQQKLDEFGNLLAKMIGVICLLVWVINYKHFFDPVHGSVLKGCIYYFKIAVALAVAAIPEGLPAVITTCLALGTRQMAKRNAIVRKLPSVETLGCTTVICSDKTGTLTTNEMCVVKLALPENGSMKAYDVEGHNYTPVGRVPALSIDWTKSKALQVLAKIGCLCNESRLLVDDEEKFVRNGEPTEAAIRVLVEKLGCPDEALNKRCLQKEKRSEDDAMAFSNHWMKGMEKRAVLEFSRDRKSMSVLWHDSSTGSNVLYAKGAPEMLVQRCSKIMLPDGQVEELTATWQKQIEKQLVQMAESALRTMALAVKSEALGDLQAYNGSHDHPGHRILADSTGFIQVEDDMTFVGMVGILDPPRPECKPAIEACRVAGISVIMITGDNKTTAEAISQKLGILAPSGSHSENSFTGQEFEALSEDRKVEVLRKIMERREVEGAVFSRTEPKHKQLIVKILKSLDEIAAMTGDGVNDAPALKQADIGIAMGIAGTEVAKEASDMVLADDNFTSIVAAVEEGRSIYNNMKAFIRYMISSNVGEVAAIFLTAALGVPEGLTPVQLLWVNLVTDGPPATALGFNPPDLDVMNKAPRRKDDALISVWSYVRYFVVGAYVGCAVVGIFMFWYILDDAPDGHTLVSLEQLLTWGSCQEWKGFKVNDFGGMSFSSDPCAYFTDGKAKASTLSLTVLVVIEMLNAFNALSEDGSLCQMPPWANPFLIVAATISIGSHFVILYIPALATIFGVVPLTLHDWMLVLAFSFPVILIDEILKLIGRSTAKSTKEVKDKKA